MGKRKLNAEDEEEQGAAEKEELAEAEIEGNESDDDEDEDESDEDDEDEEDDDDEDEQDEEQDEQDGDVKEVQVDLEFFDPTEADFHGLKALLQHYLDDTAFSSSPLVDTVIQQSTVGTVVKTDKDDDPLAIMTVLNTKRYADTPFMKEILSFLVAHSKDADMANKLKACWSADNTGLLINERLINCPPQLAPPLFQALMDEIQWATEDEPTQEKRDSFKLTHYIICTRVYGDSQPATMSAPKKKKGKGEGSQSKPTEQVIVYVRPEDEFLHKHCTLSHHFRIESKAVGKDELLPMRLMMLVEAKKMPTVQQQLNTVVGNAALADETS